MPEQQAATTQQQMFVANIELEVIRCGRGHPLVLLHGLQNIDPHARFLDLLAQHYDILAPSHPGFGHSPRPAAFETVYDLVHLYLELLDDLPYDKVALRDLAKINCP